MASVEQDLEINRVIRWAVEAAQLVNLGMATASTGLTTSIAAQQDRLALRR
jgi:hypothetical protein